MLGAPHEEAPSLLVKKKLTKKFWGKGHKRWKKRLGGLPPARVGGDRNLWQWKGEESKKKKSPNCEISVR